MKVILGELVGVRDGTEYKGRIPKVAQILERWDNGAGVTDVELRDSEIGKVEQLINKEVAVSYVERVGHKNNRAWHIRSQGAFVNLKRDVDVKPPASKAA